MPWQDGEKVLGYIKEVEYTGLTGEIKFDAEGFRSHFPLDLMEKFHNRVKKTAVWTEKGGVNYTLTATEMIGQAVMKLQNKTLRVTTTTVSEKNTQITFTWELPIPVRESGAMIFCRGEDEKFLSLLIH